MEGSTGRMMNYKGGEKESGNQGNKHGEAPCNCEIMMKMIKGEE